MRRRFRRAPRPAGMGCPAWCTQDHAIDLDIGDGIRLHTRLVGAGVELVATDDLELGTRTPAEIVVRACSGGTVTWAKRLALAVLDAADLIEDGTR